MMRGENGKRTGKEVEVNRHQRFSTMRVRSPPHHLMKKKISLSEEQAREMYYNINSYFLFIKCAENVPKVYFENLKFWNPSMNNHLRRAKSSVEALMQEFNKTFRAIDTDVVEYDAPGELDRAMQLLSRMHPDKITEVLNKIEKEYE